MTAPKKQQPTTHDDILEEIAEALDIPPSKFEEAKESYESIGEWLDRNESGLSSYSPSISPQGSFLLGTVTRPLTNIDEYDVDLVCVLEASKDEFTQESLKDAIGREVVLYTEARNMKKQPEDGRRCWTIHYADGAQFHMDVLPALPDVQRYRAILIAHGHADLAGDFALTEQAIAITDKTHPQYSQRTEDWPQSNPMGYAAWFRNRMRVQLIERKKAFAKAHSITASVDDIPDHKVKTPLQRAIQLLKRHRDCMFADDGEHKPISIIITTLAAHAYNEESTISEALFSILTAIDQHIEFRGDEVWIGNPVNPSENFADKWAEEHKKRDNFDKWLGQAREDFALYLRASSFDNVPETLKGHLGRNLVDRILNELSPTAAAVAAPSILRGTSDADELGRARAEIDQIQRSGSQAKPWTKL